MACSFRVASARIAPPRCGSSGFTSGFRFLVPTGRWRDAAFGASIVFVCWAMYEEGFVRSKQRVTLGK